MENKNLISIFYADDDADDRFLFETALQQLGITYELSSFEDGRSLENALKEIDYACDLVFLDLNMPVRNGIDTLAGLQPGIKKKGLKVIVFTTSGDPKMIQRTFELNAVLFVQKPNDFKTLTNTLQTIINQSKFIKLPVPYQDFKFQPSYG